MKICLQLTDEEFLELGGLAFGYFAHGDNEKMRSSAFGSLMGKVKERIMYRATPGQLLYLDRVIEAVRAAAISNEVDMMMVQDGFGNLIEQVDKNLDV